MRRWKRGWRRLAGTFAGSRREQDLSDELASHLELQTQDNIRGGMQPDQARRAAVLKFGGIESAKEGLRDQRGLPKLESFVKDLRYAWRGLRKSPSFLVVVILTLALGIGANTAIFSLVNQVLLHPRGIDHPERLVSIRERYEGLNLANISVSPPTFADARDSRQFFEHSAAVRQMDMNYSGSGAPERLQTSAITTEWFDVFGAKPRLGRVFAPEEDQSEANHVVVLAHATWVRLFGSDPSILGRTMELDRQPYRIIGVMEPGFAWPRSTELWVPLGLPAKDFAEANRFNESYEAVSRLRAGVSVGQAQARMQQLTERVLNSGSADAKAVKQLRWAMFAIPFTEYESGSTRIPILVLLGAVGLLLLIASSNVAGLMLARNAARSHEIAVQAALGASRARLLSRTCAESLLLAALGGAAGLLLARAGMNALLWLAPEDSVLGLDPHLDVYALLFTAAVAMASAVLFGVLPGWQASRTAPYESLKGGGRSASAARHKLRSGLVIAEAALALLLLVVAGAFLRSFVHLNAVNPGFDPHGVLTARFSLPEIQYPDGPRQIVFYRTVLDRLQATRGVTAASVTIGVPFSRVENAGGFDIEGRTVTNLNAVPHADLKWTTPDFFRSLSVPLRQGRFFSEEDRFDGPQTVVIDENLARQFWPGENPLGKRIRQNGGPWSTVVGIAGHVLQSSLETDTGKGVIYFNLFQGRRRSPFAFLLVKGPADPSTLTAAVREAFQAADPHQPVHTIKTLDDLVAGSLAARRFVMRMMAFFAATALVLAALGLYGVTHYAMTQRTREIGIRMALGAREGSVLQLVMGQGLRLAALGVAIGLAGAAALTRVLQSQLFGVSAFDPVVVALAVSVLLGMALLASYLPARRAARIDPLVALRCE